MSTKKRSNGKTPHLLRTYRFGSNGKDPVIPQINRVLNKEGIKPSDACMVSGVSKSTLGNWFSDDPKSTKRPQHATTAATLAAVGYGFKIVKLKTVDFARELEKAKAEIKAAERSK